jgi:hypothetical protein
VVKGELKAAAEDFALEGGAALELPAGLLIAAIVEALVAEVFHGGEECFIAEAADVFVVGVFFWVGHNEDHGGSG